ncbi:MAG: S-layer homology domain-containing protein [Clostridiales Family XIII bacterium]|nr:S-layer homology domain-containing protein [Clostridiales Family XIII bacterium]
MKKFTAILLALAFALARDFTAFAASADELDKAVADTAVYMLETVKAPEVGSVGGEWAVLGLARSGAAVPDAYFENYRKSVEAYVEDCDGVLHEKKYTEYSRVILGLTAAGHDPRNVAGHDLTAALGDFERTVWQGINGPIWALLALDSRDWPIPKNAEAKTQATRELYIEEILRRQAPDGGWNLTAGADGEVRAGEKGDPDITGMALQALAKYQDRREVKEATERALIFLSELQDEKGGYEGWGDVNSESVVQVLVALCELGIPVSDPRFVKNGNSLVDNILGFRNADGGFRHTTGGAGNSLMSTEQAFYGLVAAQRAAAGKNSLYRMGDAAARATGEAGAADGAEKDGLPGRHADVRPAPVTSAGKTFADIRDHADRDAIEALAARGIINGKTEADFEPDAGVTRAEFAAIVVRGLALKPSAAVVAGAGVFGDVNPDAWYFDSVRAASLYGIVGGVGNGVFNPNGAITRQEAAVMTARAAKLAGLDTERGDAEIRDALAQFDDYRGVSEWARGPLAFCYGEGILDDSALDIAPLEAATRAEIARMLYETLVLAELI